MPDFVGGLLWRSFYLGDPHGIPNLNPGGTHHCGAKGIGGGKAERSGGADAFFAADGMGIPFGVIKHGWLENGPLMCDCPIQTSF